jgi:protein-S-isoprenylcysteine O-methyltransferase Ste14
MNNFIHINLIFVVPYILVTNVFILVQLNVQFLMFLKSLLAQQGSDVTASIVRSTTVIFTAIGFWFLVCLFRATCIGVGPHRRCITVS